MVSSSFINYYMGIIHGDKKQESNLQEVSCLTMVLQPFKPVQILPFFSIRNCLLPLKVVLHFQDSTEKRQSPFMSCVISHL